MSGGYPTREGIRWLDGSVQRMEQLEQSPLFRRKVKDVFLDSDMHNFILATSKLLATLDRPVIAHLRRAKLGLDGSSQVGTAARMEPTVEMAAGSVQRPGHEPHSTNPCVPRK